MSAKKTSDKNEGAAEGSAGSSVGYQVLARKYRPKVFEDLIGQDAMVQTLSNAFATGRVAHAYIFTGVRGIGKTTTARILARALNYTKADGTPSPSVDMPEMGAHCQAILDSRHIDVIEMDAASHTGIDDVREIIDAVKYRPAIARYKVYIIDEVHMLSRQAFNGLLKTLEEPPEHVKFIFATTEIRKLPVTVLSRCQRFDLHRVNSEILSRHLTGICEKEKAGIDARALALIVRASEGSVRDALSLLDQAIAHCCASEGSGTVDEIRVREMLGLADRQRVMDLFELVMKGDVAAALDEFKGQYDAGADPAVVLSDMAELVHWITRLKLVSHALDDPAIAEDERRRGASMAERLDMRTLGRAWQMLLKGMSEVASASNAYAACDMVLVRLAHVADLPSPDELVRQLTGAATPRVATRDTASDSGNAAPQMTQAPGPSGSATRGTASDFGNTAPQMTQALVADNDPMPAGSPATEVIVPVLETFEDLLAWLSDKRDVKLKNTLERFVRPVSFARGRIEFNLEADAPRTLINELSTKLKRWTGENWLVALSDSSGEEPVAARRRRVQAAQLAEAERDPLVQKALAVFPGSKIVTVRKTGPAELNDEPNNESAGK